MSEFFDEISLDYWLANQKRINSKSYTCYHNGYVYGDDMNCDYFAFVCSFGDTEIFISEDSPRKTYVKFVETVCKQSSEILNNYRTAPAEKNRVYTEEEVLLFSKEKKTSTRIANGEIIVHGKKYYVANNLKICEYFNAAANALTEAQRDSWYIRTFFKEKHRNAPIKSVDELQRIEEKAYTNFKLHFDEDGNKRDSTADGKKELSRHAKTDYLTLNKAKKTVGDLGEHIVLEYEKVKLQLVGLNHLTKQIEHTSQDVGDNEGYDIKSFTEDGTELYIEVKSTRQNHSGGFYISQNEVETANKMYQEGKIYKIYRLYNINTKKQEAHIKIYEPPFDTTHYAMTPITWYVDKEKL